MLTTFCGQAYGSKNYKLVGTWLWIGLTVNLVISIPYLLICYNSLQIFVQFENSEEA